MDVKKEMSKIQRAVESMPQGELDNLNEELKNFQDPDEEKIKSFVDEEFNIIFPEE